MLGIVLNESMRGGRIKYRGGAVNGTYGFAGITLTHTVIELEDVVGIFYYQRRSLLPTFAPRFRALCHVKKMTDTTYHFSFT